MRMNRIKIILFFILICSASVVMGPDKAGAKGKIGLSKTSVSVGVTGEVELKLKGVSKKQAKKVSWKSSDKAVASVSMLSGDGYVMTYKTGKAVITAKYKKKCYTCKVKVTQGKSGWPYMVDPFMEKPGVHNMEWQFEDSFFNKSASEYQKKLALDSLLLSLASEPDWNVDIKEQSHKLKELLTVFGFDHYATNTDYQENTRGDTLGIGFASKKIKSAGKEYTLIAVTVRSSGYGKEWLSNIQVGTEGDHQGFSTCADKLIRDLNTYIQDQRITGPVKLWLSGHSRGATACNLAAARIADQPALPSGITSEREDIYCYGISTVKAACLENMKKNPTDDYRFIHNTFMPQDIFTMIVPDKYGFVRYGIDHEISYDETIKKKSLAKLKNYPPGSSLYDTYMKNDPDEYHGREMATRIVDTLTYAFPTRTAYMDELYPALKEMIGSIRNDMTSALNLLNSELGKRILYGYYESMGEPVPDDLYKKTTKEDGTTVENINIFGDSVIKLIAEFGHYPAMYVQHYMEVIYMFFANPSV